MCVKEALSYDVRVLPRAAIDDLLKQHEALVRDTLDKVIGHDLSDLNWATMQLPGPLGGFGVRVPLTSADAAYLATYHATAAR
eukprot:12430549-Karenia_brevis.AAC.1